jgi:hypothetical protein
MYRIFLFALIILAALCAVADDVTPVFHPGITRVRG